MAKSAQVCVGTSSTSSTHLFRTFRDRHPPEGGTAAPDDAWTAAAGTGHHALAVGTCRSLDGFEPDRRYRSNDADVQLELVRATGAVAMMPALTLQATDPALAVRDVAEAAVRRRLMVLTRDRPTAPALDTLLATVGPDTVY